MVHSGILHGKMKALIVHNLYQQPGGEDKVFAAEAAPQSLAFLEVYHDKKII